jgi:hypothetical protein
MNTLEEAARIFVVSAKPMKLLEFLQACLEGRLDALGPMIGVPEFRGDEHFLPFDLPCLEDLLHGFADLFLGPVTFRSVERAKPCSSAATVAFLVAMGSGISVPKPSAGIAPASLLTQVSQFLTENEEVKDF